jgi:hypothetical protein
MDNANAYWLYSSLGTILNRTGWGRGSWTNIVFPGGQPLTAIGQRGAHESLIYLVTADTIFPAGATTAALPTQNGQTLLLTNWPAGSYYAEWYDPATGALVGNSQAATTNGGLRLSLPDYSVDLAGLVYAPPTLQALGVDGSGHFQFQLTSESGGRYTVQESSNLLQWTPSLIVTNTLGTMGLVAPDSMTANPSMFFRATRN